MPDPIDPLIAVARRLHAQACRWPPEAELTGVRAGDVLRLYEAVLAAEPRPASVRSRRPDAKPSPELLKAFDVLLGSPKDRAEPRPSSLDHEIGVYRSRLDELLGPGDCHEGKFAVVKGDLVQWPFRDFGEAIKYGYDRFGLVPFLVKEINRVEKVHRI